MDMSAYVKNWRRTPRIPARLSLEITHHGETWAGQTEDLGPGGLLLISPKRLIPGTALRLVLHSEEICEALNVAGDVAWCMDIRGGIKFSSRQVTDPQAWFQRFVALQPLLAAARGTAPEELSLTSPIYFLPAPREAGQFTQGELALLRNAENGISVKDLIARARLGEPEVRTTLLGLFEKKALTLSLGQASDPWRWRALVSQPLPTPARSALPVIERPARSGVQPSTPARPAAVLPRAGAAQAQAPAPARPSVQAAQPPLRASPPRPAEETSADAWGGAVERAGRAAQERGPFRPPSSAGRAAAVLLRGTSAAKRSPKAQERFEEGQRLANEGRIHDAVQMLRDALNYSPRDAEISRLLGELAFRRA
jgi:hypothetical protein